MGWRRMFARGKAEVLVEARNTTGATSSNQKSEERFLRFARNDGYGLSTHVKRRTPSRVAIISGHDGGKKEGGAGDCRFNSGLVSAIPETAPHGDANDSRRSPSSLLVYSRTSRLYALRPELQRRSAGWW